MYQITHLLGSIILNSLFEYVVFQMKYVVFPLVVGSGVRAVVAEGDLLSNNDILYVSRDKSICTQ